MNLLRNEGWLILQDSVQKNIELRMKKIVNLQMEDGSWRFNFDGPILTDCFMIILIRSLNISTDDIEAGLLNRIVNLQQQNGSWKLYSDEVEGNLSATIQAYTAMLLSGKYTREHNKMKKAEKFIKENGGLRKSHFMTKMMLVVNGFYSYPTHFHFPMAYYLLPTSVPMNMYQCSNYARIHLTPMLICMNRKYTFKHSVDSSFFDEIKDNKWFREDRASFDDYFKQIKHIAFAPSYLQKAGFKEAEKMMLNRVEENGTLYSYATSTFYMIYALLALGYEKESSIIQNAMKGMFEYIIKTREGLHLQNSPSTIWDTALLSYSLQEAGMSEKHPTIQKASKYLLSKQQSLKGDWAIHAPSTSPGGWGFSESNQFTPDNDDTSAVLRALTGESKTSATTKKAYEKGVAFLLDMQNKDGGWGAFEKNAYHTILAHLPIENAKDALVDDSTADLTGRVLEFLGNFVGLNEANPSIKKAMNWLIKNQNDDGSWYGKWGICYIYGTWAAVSGLRAVGMKKDHPTIIKAIQWLESKQRVNGGWGESCMSAEKETYIPLPFSTPSQTAWALDTLLTVRNPSMPSVQKAVQFLVDYDFSNKEATYYPTGMGLRGGFYIYYESYNELFPLLALGHYRKKLLSNNES